MRIHLIAVVSAAVGVAQNRGTQIPATFERGPSVVSGGMAGSTVAAPATTEVLKLTLRDTIERGLKYNLALAESGEDERLRRTQRLITLSKLLPELSVRPSVNAQQVSLAAFGFTGFGGVPSVVGPFSVFDLRATVSQPLLDMRQRRTLRADRENELSTVSLGADLRGKVALFVSGLYLQALAARSRVETQQALVKTAERVFQQAADRHEAGTVPRIDVLRAQVQLDAERDRLISFEGEFEKQNMNLARAIGLSAGQPLELVDPMPDEPSQGGATVETTLEQAYTLRADYKAAQALVRASEFERAAAQAGRYPTAEAEANYGVIGPSINHVHGTFAVGVGMNIPLFQGGKTKAEVEAADTVLRRRRAELEDLRGRIEAEVRAAFTDLRSSARQVEVARRAAGLAREQLNEAQDRFAAGVTNSLEVVQAQQATAAANENYIAALYGINVARAAFLLARGDAEQSIQEFFRRNK
jgi:outer membrane protein TolC